MKRLFCTGKANLLFLFNIWLTLEEICRLDSALCNRENRRPFLEMISRRQLIIRRNDNIYTTETYMKWLKFRNLETNELNFSYGPISAFTSELDFSHINVLTMRQLRKDSMEVMCKILVQAIHLVELNLISLLYLCEDSESKEMLKNCHLRELAKLHLSLVPNLTDSSLHLITQHSTKIERLVIRNCCGISEECMRVLIKANNEYLTDLDLCPLKESYAVIQAIGTCYKLTHLDLGDNNVFSIMPVIEKLSNLREMCLPTFAHKSYNMDSMTQFALRLCNIHTLHISGSYAHCSVNDAGISKLCAGCPRITDLALSFSNEVSTLSVLTIVHYLHQLHTVIVRNGDDLKIDYSMNVFADHFSTLSGIDYLSCRVSGLPYGHYDDSLTIKQLEEKYPFTPPSNDPVDETKGEIPSTLLALQQPQLEAVNPLANKVIQDCIPKCSALHTFCPSKHIECQTLELLLKDRGMGLVHLDLSAMHRSIETQQLIAIATYCQSITFLSLSGCCGVSDEGLSAVVLANPQLTHLDCFECDALSDYSIATIADVCKSLHHLTISHCTASEYTLTEIIEHNHRLIELHVNQQSTEARAALCQVARAKCLLLHKICFGSDIADIEHCCSEGDYIETAAPFADLTDCEFGCACSIM